MKIALLTDSNSGIKADDYIDNDIYVLPMPIIIDNVDYFENENLDHEDFFKKQMEGKKISTSQPPLQSLINYFDHLLNSGYDQILYMPMSSALSSAYGTAKMIAREYDGRIEVVDNHRISVTQKHAIIEADEYRKLGMNAKEIKERLENEAYDSLIFIAVDTLDYLVKGGRLTKSCASMANLINIKPLLIIEGEKLDAYTKTRGIKKCKKILIKEIAKYVKECRKDGYETYITASGSLNDNSLIEEWLDEIKHEFPEEEIHYEPLSLSICTHIGQGSYAIGVSKKHPINNENLS